MRDGFEFIDTDHHVGPNMETLHNYAGPELLARWDELLPYYVPVTEGHHMSIDPIPYARDLYTGTTDEQSAAEGAGADMPLRKAIKLNYGRHPAPEVNNENWQGRLDDMDAEGVDIALIFPATFSTASTVLDVELQNGLYDAYHRYLDAYCSSAPDRLKAAALMNGRDPRWSAAALRSIADKPWLAACAVILPEGLPADDPSLDPIWEAMDEADLPLVHHSFFYEPPYFPGYRDIWGNLAIARMASHPWGAQRLTAYVTLSGMFDRYPNLRLGFAECSGGWLGGWLNRMTYQADYLAARLPRTKRTPIEYALDGRIFCGVELDEGADVVLGVAAVLGDGVLMYSSDYPHGGCRFPASTDVVLDWREKLGDETFARLASGNARRFLRI
jgi:predicted TIM-barrel fold metal-dependent hydrolase